MTLTHEQELPVISRLKVISNMDITERRRPQDGHLSFDLENNSYDIRVATLPTHLGEKMVLRILDESKVLKGLFQLGFEPDDLEKVKGMCKKPYGMILETGPIGSGKTTTLYSCLNEINVMTSNIVTIEDPIEYQLPGINQVNVDAKVNLTFATGLRAILRQDADVLMVGEIRDAETAAIAVRAAMTGHLLFSTLHTNDAPGAITTLQHLGIKPFLISSSLIGVIAQRLVRKICLNCRQPYAPSPDEKELLGLSPKDKTKLYKGTGCEKCFRTGYHGRTGVFEVMQIDEELKDLIVHEAPEAQLRETAIQKGMSTLKMSGIQKVLDGTTTIEEMLRVINL
jgi:type II secretory ATPase GspE/PulE/Tfp pilus assembly ATPase PilB-like protein